MQRPLVAWDLETKGVGRHQDRIIEFGAVKRFADARPDEIKLLRFKPPFYVSPHILAAHNISLRDFCRAPPFAARAAEITTFLAGCDFVGHNLKRFDIPMLGAALGRAQGKTWGIDFDWPAPDTRVLDTLDLFRRFMPDKVRAGGNHKLGTCYAFYTGRPLINAHSAVADSQACMDVAFAMAAASATGVAVGLGHGQMHTTIEDLDAYGRSLTAAQSARSGSEAQRVTQAID